MPCLRALRTDAALKNVFGYQSLVCLLTALLLAAAANNRAYASTLYTVNTLSDHLVSINTATGATTDIGAIGFDFHLTELAFFNGEIYALTSDIDNVFDVQPNYTLLKIDRNTGAKVSTVPITQTGGTPERIIESMGVAAGKLWIGGHPAGLVSQYLGQLDPTTGVISNQLDYSLIPGIGNYFGSFGVDLDNMTRDASDPSKLIALDGDAGLISLVHLDPISVTASPIAQFNLPGAGDIATTPDGFFMIGNGQLYTVHPGGSPLVTSIALSPVGNFSGLAVPEPSSLVLVGLASLACAVAGLRRRDRLARSVNRVADRLNPRLKEPRNSAFSPPW